MIYRLLPAALLVAVGACAGSPSAAAEPAPAAGDPPRAAPSDPPRAAPGDPSGTIRVVATGFRSGDGQALIAVYDSKQGFPNDADAARLRRAAPIAGGQAAITFGDLPPGRYAVAVLHDENDNYAMDTGAFGIPKEGYGVSNNAKGRFGPPKWKDAVFALAAGQTVTQRIRLIYP